MQKTVSVSFVVLLSQSVSPFVHIQTRKNDQRVTNLRWSPFPIKSKKDDNLDPANEQQVFPNILNPSRKQRFQKLREGQAASAAMDLPEQPVIKTIPGGLESIFRTAREFSSSAATPRWHPQQQQQQPKQSSVVSPSSAAAASLIWRNARKRNKPALWRYALRTLDRVDTPTNVHYEGALVAAAHLGDAKSAWELFHRVESSQPRLQVTDNMILSLTRACVKARDPFLLEQVMELLKDHHDDSTTTSMHWNPIAAALATMGEASLARKAMQQLPDREQDYSDEDEDDDRLYVADVHAKDAASYAIAVNVAVGEKDWGAAIDALRNMTEDAGLAPTSRHLHRWAELGDK